MEMPVERGVRPGAAACGGDEGCGEGELALADLLAIALIVLDRARGDSDEGQEAFVSMLLNCRAARAGGAGCPARLREGGAPCLDARWPGLRDAAARADFADAEFRRALVAVLLVVSGLRRDRTQGATRFHAHDETPGWAEGETPKALIGRHFFYAPRLPASEGAAGGPALGRGVSDSSTREC